MVVKLHIHQRMTIIIGQELSLTCFLSVWEYSEYNYMFMFKFTNLVAIDKVGLRDACSCIDHYNYIPLW